MIQNSFAATDIQGIYGMVQPENIASRRESIRENRNEEFE